MSTSSGPEKLWDVVIVGGGVSGLSTAKTLHKLSPSLNVCLVEASHYVGGRVKQSSYFGDRKIDLGAEFIHGEQTPLMKLLEDFKIPTHYVFDCVTDLDRRKLVHEWLFFGKEKRMISIGNPSDRDLAKLESILSNEKEDQVPDNSLLEYLVSKGSNSRLLSIVDALIAKSYGTDIHKISAKGYLKEEANARKNDFGKHNLRPDNSFSSLIESLKEGLNIKTNWQLKVLDNTKPNEIRLLNQRNQEIIAKRVVITVPLTVLQDGDISFCPKLPLKKIKAAHSLIMDPGMKVVLKFSREFWPNNNKLVVCSDCAFPQIWTQGNDSKSPIVVGFATGDSARYLRNLSNKDITQILLSQLDYMYSTSNNPTPASSVVVDGIVYDWSKNPFIRGSYSAPGKGSEGARQILAEPFDERIFFAGEATNTNGASATIHGAIETGNRAAIEVSKSLPSVVTSKL